jgi:hypothetical protein
MQATLHQNLGGNITCLAVIGLNDVTIATQAWAILDHDCDEEPVDGQCFSVHILRLVVHIDILEWVRKEYRVETLAHTIDFT